MIYQTNILLGTMAAAGTASLTFILHPVKALLLFLTLIARSFSKVFWILLISVGVTIYLSVKDYVGEIATPVMLQLVLLLGCSFFARIWTGSSNIDIFKVNVHRLSSLDTKGKLIKIFLISPLNIISIASPICFIYVGILILMNEFNSQSAWIIFACLFPLSNISYMVSFGMQNFFIFSKEDAALLAKFEESLVKHIYNYENSITLSIGWEIIKESVYADIHDTNEIIDSLKIDTITPENLPIVFVLKYTEQFLSSGRFHTYRGILSIRGQSLRALWSNSLKQLLDDGFYEESTVNKIRRELDEKISQVG